jgi:hypothetical protein
MSSYETDVGALCVCSYASTFSVVIFLVFEICYVMYSLCVPPYTPATCSCFADSVDVSSMLLFASFSLHTFTYRRYYYL